MEKAAGAAGQPRSERPMPGNGTNIVHHASMSRTKLKHEVF